MPPVSDLDNLYLCPDCDHVGPLKEHDMVCEECGFRDCYVAKHMNEGTRKHWIRNEASDGVWRFDKKLKSMMKDATPDEKELVKEFEKTVKGVFRQFEANKHNFDEIFARFVRDYKRTTGRRETGWKGSSKSLTKRKQSSQRGELYQSAMNHMCKDSQSLVPIKIPLGYYDKLTESHSDYEPDFWFKHNGLDIPVEFKTFDKSSMVKSKFKRGVLQSRRYGNLSFMKLNNPDKLSAIIVCCPEEKLFSCAVIDERAKSIL